MITAGHTPESWLWFWSQGFLEVVESFLVLRKATVMIQGLEKKALRGDVQQAQHTPLQEFNREDPSPGAPAEMSGAQTAQQHRRTLTQVAVEIRSFSFQPMTANMSRPGRKVLKAVQRSTACQQGLNYQNLKDFGDGSHQKMS